MEQTRRKRPWLAAILGAVATGLGHLYLRRWQRALGWLLASLTTMFFFVPTSAINTLDAMMWGTGSVSVPSLDLLIALFPLLAVGAASVLDAYLIARTNNRQLLEQQLGIERCPDCGRPIDPDVSFCQWCATPRDTDDRSESTER
jgi:hypothetical protein